MQIDAVLGYVASVAYVHNTGNNHHVNEMCCCAGPTGPYGYSLSACPVWHTVTWLVGICLASRAAWR